MRGSYRRALRRASRGAAGQGLVELALAMPVLLLILLGIADVGRAFYYTVMITGAARETAAYAASHPSASASAVAQHGCNATGLAAFGTPCPAAFSVSCLSACPTNGADATIRVTYSFSLISAFLVDRALNVNPIVLRADAHFPGVGQ